MFKSGSITNAKIRLDTDGPQELEHRNRLHLVIEGITTGAQATSVTWRRNGSIIDRNTMVANGSFSVGGGDTIVSGNPCERRMYRVALLVTGYLPGTYTYTANNSYTSPPVTSPEFEIQGTCIMYCE